MSGFFCAPLLQVGLKVRFQIVTSNIKNYLSGLTRKNYNETFISISFITPLQNKTKNKKARKSLSPHSGLNLIKVLGTYLGA